MKTIKEKIDNFWRSRTAIKNPRIATNYREDGRLAYDIAFVSQFVHSNSKILDLGAGTCTLVTAFLDTAKKIVAVDKFDAFLELAPKHPTLETYCSDMLDFRSDELFDIILLFGVVNFISIEEEKKLYETCFSMLNNNGLLIVKNQCGIHEEVIVDNYSEQLQADYYARYPFAEIQFNLLSTLFDVKQSDIYPTEINLWKNTHFYAFIGKKLCQ